MGATGKKVLTHPRKEEITNRLLKGQSPASVAKWLRTTYNRDKGFWLSKMTLQAYRTNFLNLTGEVLDDVKKEYAEEIKKQKEEQALQKVQKMEAYQSAKTEVAQGLALQIRDTQNQLQSIWDQVHERLEILRVQKTSHLNDKVMVEYFRLLKDCLKESHEVAQELRADQSTTIDINVAELTKELRLIKAALRETFAELPDPDLWRVFFDKFKGKMENAQEAISPADFPDDGLDLDSDMPTTVQIQL